MNQGLANLAKEFGRIGHTDYWLEKDILVTKIPSKTSEIYLHIKPIGMIGISKNWCYMVREVVVRDNKTSEHVYHMMERAILDTIKLYQPS